MQKRSGRLRLAELMSAGLGLSLLAVNCAFGLRLVFPFS